MREHSVVALGRIGDARAVPPLCAALRDEGVRARAAAAAALVSVGEPAVPPLCAALEDGDECVRLTAMEALGQIAECAAIPALRAALPRLRERLAPWRGWSAEERQVAAALLDQIEGTTAATKDLPLPAAADDPSNDGLPIPAPPPAADAAGLPIPSAAEEVSAAKKAN